MPSITLPQPEFGRIVSVAAKAAPARSPIQTHECLRFEAEGERLRITGGDGELSITTEATLSESVDPWRFALPAKEAARLITKLPGPLTIAPDNNQIAIEAPCGVYRFGVNEEAVKDRWMPQAKEEGANSTHLDARLFRAIVNASGFVAKDEFRPQMQGVFVEERNGATDVVATDGFRLIRYRFADYDCGGASVILPTALIRAASDMKEPTLTTEENHISLSEGKATVRHRAIDERFPNWERVIPEESGDDVAWSVNRKGLSSALQRLLAMTTEARHVRFAVDSDGLELRVMNAESGRQAHETLPVTTKGAMESKFNAEFFQQTLSLFGAEEVRIAQGSALNPAVITSEKDPELLALVMPVRL